MRGMAKDILMVLVGIIMTLIAFIANEKFGNLDEANDSIDKNRSDFMEKMMNMQSSINSKLTKISLEVSGYAGDVKALQVSLDNFNKSSEKDISRLSDDLKSYVIISERRITTIEKKLDADNERIDNIESYLKALSRKRGVEVLNFNIFKEKI